MEDCAADHNGNPRFGPAAVNSLCDILLYILLASLLLHARAGVQKCVGVCT